MKRNRHTHKHHTHTRTDTPTPTLTPTHNTTHVVRITLCTHILNTQHTQIPDYTPHLTCGSCCGTGVARQTLWASCRRACALHRPRRRPPDTSSARAFTLRTLRQRYNCKYSQKKLTHIHTHTHPVGACQCFAYSVLTVCCVLWSHAPAPHCIPAAVTGGGRQTDGTRGTPVHGGGDQRLPLDVGDVRGCVCVRVCLGVYACV